MRTRQLYLPETNILLTRFLSDEGVVELTISCLWFKDKDRHRYGHHVLRMIRVIKGEVRFEMRCAPRFDYARGRHTITCEDHSICFHSGRRSPSMALHATFPMRVEGDDAVAEFTLKAGETATVAFGEVDEEEQTGNAVLDPKNIEEHFEETAKFWRGWIAHSNYKGRWREMVNRSALTAQTADSAPTRIARRRADFRPARANRRRAELGLSLHLDARLFIHALRLDSPRLYRGSEAPSCAGSRPHARARPDGPLQLMYRPGWPAES